MKTHVAAISTAILVSTAAFSEVHAAPMVPDPVQVKDPDGTVHSVLLHGDEYLSWASDLDGYPVERGADGVYRYMAVDGDGSWIATDVRMDTASPRALGLTPWPSMDPARAAAGDALRRQFPNFRIPATKKVSPAKPKGKLRALVIPMGFPDKKLTKSVAEIQALFDGPVHDYYAEASGGQLDLSATVTTPLNMQSGTAASYAWNSDHPSRPAWSLFDAAYKYLNETKQMDFTPFDQNGDGYADLVIVVHAGTGHEQSGDTNDIHSHFMALSSLSGYPETYKSHDGIRFFGYVIVPEMSTDGSITPMGVMVHESGHYFGLPDLYHTGSSSNGGGVGKFCLMSTGMWLGPKSGTSPAHPSAWCKSALGWLTPETTTLSGHKTLAPMEGSGGKVLRIDTHDNASDSKQYFLLENRQLKGFDAHLPGPGLLIFHVDEGAFPAAGSADQYKYNKDPEHYAIDLEQADGLRHLNTSTSRGDANDPFPTAANDAFTPVSNPSSLAYGATDGSVMVTNIRREGSDITFDFSLHAALENGSACESDGECVSGICGGTCCLESCSGLCNRVCAAQRPVCPLPSDGTCDDGNACTTGDHCEAGLCVGTAKDCMDGVDVSCVTSVYCDATDGRCHQTPVANGTFCAVDDMTEGDRECAGSDTGYCMDGACVLSSANDGMACDDGDMCTGAGTCLAGRCALGARKECPAPDECHLPGTCNSKTGACTSAIAPDGTACGSGTCQAGVCKGDSSGSDGGCGAASGRATPGTALGALLTAMLFKRRRASHAER